METSSPLAAMHRPAPVFGQRDIYRSNPHLAMSPGNGRANFSFRDQFKPEYFNLKVHGSSPAGSLAADLCQNFTIGDDGSPRFPTPRRALFTANHMGGTETRGFLNTPPLVPSSPLAVEDMMDMSPLPRKAPFIATIEIHSPSPAQSPDDSMMSESPTFGHRSLEPPKPVLPERRKPGLRRPSLTRTKGYSIAGVPGRLHADNQPSLFRFGEANRAPFQSSSLSLTECFDDSPPQERRPQSANSSSPCANALGSLRQKPHFGSLSNTSASRNGSPVMGSSHARKTSNPFSRPRRQYRRSLSMFENPGDMIKPKKEESSPPQPNLTAVMDIEEPHEPVLPHFFPEGQDDSIPRIDRTTLLEVLDGKYNVHFDHKLVIDCRFEYEYDGGHISEAINYNDKELLATHLFRTPMEGRTLIVLHCEYSAHRAPLMARHIRAEDRAANAECYPKLTYPELYILDGGYSGFFAEHPLRCYPQAYVEMDAAEHAFTCEREMGRLRQNRKGLHRAQTYAFGEQDDRCVNDSPTAPGRPHAHNNSPSMMIGASPILGSDRSHARRMASY